MISDLKIIFFFFFKWNDSAGRNTSAHKHNFLTNSVSRRSDRKMEPLTGMNPQVTYACMCLIHHHSTLSNDVTLWSGKVEPGSTLYARWYWRMFAEPSVSEPRHIAGAHWLKWSQSERDLTYWLTWSNDNTLIDSINDELTHWFLDWLDGQMNEWMNERRAQCVSGKALTDAWSTFTSSLANMVTDWSE